MAKRKEKIVPHIVKTFKSPRTGATIHICDNFYRDISPEEMERRREEVRRVCWQLIHKWVDEGREV